MWAFLSLALVISASIALTSAQGVVPSVECQCCSEEGDLDCCSACLSQSTTLLTDTHPSRHEVKRRGGYRSRSRFSSSCTCCFTRRLRWCCDVCTTYAKRTYYRPSKRSPIVDTPFYVNYNSPRTSQSLPSADQYLSDAIDDVSRLDVVDRKSPSYDCLCCDVFRFGECCDRCSR